MIVRHRECVTRDKGDLLFEGEVEHPAGRDTGPERDPEVEPALRIGPADAGPREAVGQRLASVCLLPSVEEAKCLKVRLGRAPMELDSKTLRERRVQESIVCFAAAIRFTVVRSAIAQPTRRPGRNVFENVPTLTTPVLTASVARSGMFSPRKRSAPYGSSSSTSAPYVAASASSYSRRPYDSVSPVGF